jgi:prevent-host-death family protein
MRSVGIRELRQNPAPAINEAKRGGIVEILERGTPVAMIVPLPGVREFSPYERMLADRTITPATSQQRSAINFSNRAPSTQPLTDSLLQLREDERY